MAKTTAVELEKAGGLLSFADPRMNEVFQFLFARRIGEADASDEIKGSWPLTYHNPGSFAADSSDKRNSPISDFLPVLRVMGLLELGLVK